MEDLFSRGGMESQGKIQTPARRDGTPDLQVGRGEFLKILSDVKGPDSNAVREWKRLEAFMQVTRFETVLRLTRHCVIGLCPGGRLCATHCYS